MKCIQVHSEHATWPLQAMLCAIYQKHKAKNFLYVSVFVWVLHYCNNIGRWPIPRPALLLATPRPRPLHRNGKQVSDPGLGTELN